MSLHLYRGEALEAIARRVISQYDPGLLREPAPIPVEAIMEKVYGLTIEYQYIRKNGRVLGETVFEDAMVPIYERKNNEGYKLIPVRAGTVIIDTRLLAANKKGRYRYTCAHELAHCVIDEDYFTHNGKMAAMTRTVTRSSETDAAIERQANRLGSYLLMPKGTVKMAFYRSRGSSDIIADLAALFEVSAEAMEIRLKEMKLLV